eukprot:CAMPEP_0178502558 /NCGR_PEP_ID=MMETSP0696-20121128/17568_1 /TAXON_ID=265572 /ORGANISM="Extubocellulus spinifer, Strain CCMP396" /LENGTH=373 /DNA_ID=CAMNT_0020131623 /DNA_START=48 /DNA_END=1169 /DNA_ORIENTATION=-
MMVQYRCGVAALTVATLLPLATAFAPSEPSSAHVFNTAGSSTSPRFMISNLPGLGGSAGLEPSLPRDVKDAVSKCRASTQAALEKRLSRMDIEMPVGANFGVEKTSAGGGKKKGGGRMADLGDNAPGTPTLDQLHKSDRELARIFVEMFQPVGGEHISVVFKDESLAEVARKRWRGELGADCRVLAVGRKGKAPMRGMGGGGKRGGGKKKKMGFAAKMAAEIEGDGASGPFKLPDGTEVALFVSPGPKELIAVERVCNEVGMGTLVVLLNARLGKVENYGTEETQQLFTDEFETVFHLAAAPQIEAPGCLMHRAYPTDWILARKPKIGAPKTIATFSDKPTPEECAEAYGSIEISDIEKTTENVIENVAGWFS